MTKYNTGNPIGSTAVKDLYDNAENLDVLVNDKSKLSHPDRLGVERKTWHGMEQDFELFMNSSNESFQQFLLSSGYQDLGDYGAGLEITARNQTFWRNGELYRAGASLELPYTTTGDWETEESMFVSVGDAALRQDLANPDKGAAMVARGVVAVDSIADLLVLTEEYRREDLRYLVKGYHPDSDVGGGEFVYDAARSLENDGGSVIDGFVRVGGVTHATQFGAQKNIDSTTALQNYAAYAAPIYKDINVSDGPFLFSSTIDVSSHTERPVKFVGNANNISNKGVPSLIYTGTGIGIDAHQIELNRFEIAGTLNIIDPIPVGTIGIRHSQNRTCIHSFVRNFDTAFKATGGYYHKVFGGAIRRCRIIYDHEDVTMYNFSINDTAHSNFQIGVLASGGNGPLKIGGSWEQWTEAVVKTKGGADRYQIILDGPYIENYPNTQLVDGLTSPTGTYVAPHAFNIGNSPISGAATIHCAGITESVFKTIYPRVIDVAINFVNTATENIPTYLFEGLRCDSLSLKNNYNTGGFDNIDIVNPALENSFTSSGFYVHPDSSIRVPRTAINGYMRNGWTTAVTGPYIVFGQGFVTLSGTLNASGATSTYAFEIIPLPLRPKNIDIRAAGTSNSAADNYTVVVRPMPNGEVRIQTPSGGVPVGSSISFSITYSV